MEHISTEIRVPIEKDNPSILRYNNKCIQCGHCSRVCRSYMSVLDNYDLLKTGGKAVCVNCGQCAIECPVNCIAERKEYDLVRNEILSGDKIVIVSTSPSIRVSIGELFGMAPGAFVEGKMVALLKRLGFNYVLDTNFSADLTIMEEANELINRIKGKKALPQFTSCCPSWVKFVETFYPQYRDNLSTCKSPIAMQGVTIKTYFAKKMCIDPSKIINVALTPCTAKKMEIRRDELNASSKFNNIENMRDMDYVITTRELVEWATEEKIDFRSLKDCEFDRFMGEASGAGVIFGKSGGVAEAAVRTAYKMLTGKTPDSNILQLKPVEGNGAIRDAVVKLGKVNLRVCVIYGLRNARTILDNINNGCKYDFVEVMTCPNGCVGGGGQPKNIAQHDRVIMERGESLTLRDNSISNKVSCDNTQIIELYNEFYGKQGSKLAEELLHTYYVDRSSDLGIKTAVKKYIKYRCKTCGATFDVEVGKNAICPMCLADGEDLEIIEEFEK